MGDKLSMDVDFGTVSVGDQTASLGMTFDKSKMGLEKADELLCGSRLAVKIIPGAKGTAPNQKQIPDAFDKIEAEIDCKHYGVKPDAITARFAFNRSAIDLAILTSLVKRSGKVTLERIGDAETAEEKREKSKAHPDVELGKDKPHGTPGLFAVAQEMKRRGKDAGYALEITTLIRKNLKGLCKEHGVEYDNQGLTDTQVESIQSTFGIKGPMKIAELEKVMNDDAYWHQKIKGFGQTRVDALIDALVIFRRCCPVPSADDVEEDSEPSSDELIDIFKEGCEASLEGKSEADNPYAAESDEGQAWLKGFRKTQDQDADAGTVLDGAEEVANPNADQDANT